MPILAAWIAAAQPDSVPPTISRSVSIVRTSARALEEVNRQQTATAETKLDRTIMRIIVLWWEGN
jgi:hypothetical protein